MSKKNQTSLDLQTEFVTIEFPLCFKHGGKRHYEIRNGGLKTTLEYTEIYYYRYLKNMEFEVYHISERSSGLSFGKAIYASQEDYEDWLKVIYLRNKDRLITNEEFENLSEDVLKRYRSHLGHEQEEVKTQEDPF